MYRDKNKASQGETEKKTRENVSEKEMARERERETGL